MSIFQRAGGQMALVAGLALIPTAAATPAAPRGVTHTHQVGAHTGTGQASHSANSSRVNVGTTQTTQQVTPTKTTTGTGQTSPLGHPTVATSGTGQTSPLGQQTVAHTGTGQTSPLGHQNKTNTGTTNKQHQNQNNAAAMTELKAAHALLVHQADHDYQGHRAKAAHQVSSAIHALSGGNNNGGAGGKNQQAGGKNQQGGVQVVANNQQAGGQGNVKVPQAQSDANLHKATQMLHTALGQVHSGHQATTHIHAAINELNTALKIK